MTAQQQLDIPERKKNPEPVTIIAGTAVGLAALIAWLLARDDKRTKKRPTGGPGPGDNGDTDDGNGGTGGGTGGGGGGGLQPGDQGLYISDDCKRVIEGKDWMESYAVPRIVEYVRDQGKGLPIYSPSQVDQSIDWVIRQIARPWGPNCVDQAPWLDQYVKENPIPIRNPGETYQEYKDRLDAWDNEWDQKISSWASQHQQLFELFKRVGNVVVDAYFGKINIPLGPGSDKGGQSLYPRMNQDIKQALIDLGYDIEDYVIQAFQDDFNLVMDYISDWEWTTSDSDIAVDNKIGQETVESLAAAMQLQSSKGPWQALVYTAQENLV